MRIFERQQRRRREEVDRQYAGFGAGTKDERQAPVVEQSDLLDSAAAQPLVEFASQPPDKDPIGEHQTFLFVKTSIVVAALLLAACSSASPAPKGWTPVPGGKNLWSTGSGAERQEYSYSSQTFPGQLSDLSSRVTIDVLLKSRGARLRSSNPLAPCPGAAGLATFSLAGERVLQVGFAVADGQAVRVTYVRPASAPADPNVAAAMQSALC